MQPRTEPEELSQTSRSTSRDLAISEPGLVTVVSPVPTQDGQYRLSERVAEDVLRDERVVSDLSEQVTKARSDLARTDTKAGLLSATVAAVIAVAATQVGGAPGLAHPVARIAAVLALLAACASQAHLLAAAMPILRSATTKAATQPDHDLLATARARASNRGIAAAELAEEASEINRLALRKFKHVRHAIWCLGASAPPALITVAFSLFNQ